MKKNLFRTMFGLSALLLAVSFTFTSCTEEVEEPKLLVEDGWYVKGAGTALVEADIKGLMKSTKNEVGQVDRAALKELFVAVKAGAAGFNIINVVGGVPTVYGPGADFKVVAESERNVDEPKVDFWRGSYAAVATPFTVPADGLYHVVIDTELKKVAVAPVVWGMIGAATPGGWSESTPLTATFDLNKMEFKIENMKLMKGDFKYRYSQGWKIILDAEYDNGAGKEKGVKVNTNFGGTVATLEPGGANITNSTLGFYKATVVWELGKAYVATLTKTGDVEVINYSNTALGLTGDGVYNASNAIVGWGPITGEHKPVVTDGTKYTWTWNGVKVTKVGSLKIKDADPDWKGKVIGYKDVTVAGLAASKFGTNNDGNFVPTEDGYFDFVLEIDAVTESYKLTVSAAGAPAPELFILGDATTAGWDNTKALPLEKVSEGKYTITTTLTTGKVFKFIKTLGQWAPMYGTNAQGTATSGTLVYRATESDPDPTSIPAPAATGSYKITVDITAMTYTVATAK